MIHRFVIIIFNLLLCSSVFADNVKFTAHAKNTARVGERFRLTYKVNAQGQNFTPPSLEHFSVLVGPSTSSSSSVQIINGKVTRSVEISYTYVLQPTKKGEFTIAPAKITVDGQTHQSNSVNIKVLEGDEQAVAQQPSSSGNQSQQTTASTKDPSVSDKNVFLRAYASRYSPYQGEKTIVTFKLYFKINISLDDITQFPGYNGFWSYDLMKDRQNYPQYTEVVNNQRYNVAEIAKVALYPQKSGKITIDPMKIKLKAKIRQKNRRPKDPFEAFFNDSFFGNYKTVEKNVASNSLTINVKPLPSQGKPYSFNGAVGDYKFSSDISSTETSTNDAINLKISISGNGNLKLIDAPEVNFPPDFEVYDPKIEDNTRTTIAGMSGTRIFDYLIIPRSAGEFTIDPVKFTYFDLGQQKYITKSSPEYNIKVAKGAGGDAQNVTYSSANKKDIQYIGSDIRYIENLPFALSQKGHHFFGSNLFYILIAAPFILFLLFMILWRKKVRQNRNIAKMKQKKATKVARKKLKLAKKYLAEENKNAFYDEITKAMWGYLSDKLNIPVAELTKDNVKENFEKTNTDPELAGNFIDILENAEFARFAPGDESTKMDKIYDDTLNIITTIEKEMNKKAGSKNLTQ